MHVARIDSAQHLERLEASRDGAAEPETEVAEFPLLPAVDVLADAAREDQSVERSARDQRLRKPRRRVLEPLAEWHAEHQIRDPFGDRVEGAVVTRVANGDADAGLFGDARAGASDRADPSAAVPRKQARADVDRGRLFDASTAADGELRRAAANVDVQHDRGGGVARERDRARSVRGEQALEVMARRRADELPGLSAEELHDGRRVLLSRRLTGRDHRARVDVIRPPTRPGVRALDEPAERVGVDAALGDVRGEHHLGAMHRGALDDGIGARKTDALTL